MTGRYKAYPEYKNSGVEWLGDIPINWMSTRHKFIASFTKGRNPSTLSDKQQEGMLPYLSMDYLRGKELPKFSFIDSGSYATKLKQILLIWDGSNAGEFVIGKEGILSSTMAASELISKIDVGFYWYLCTCIEPEMRKHATGMGIPHVNGQELRDSVFPLPKPEEQQKIANFLDHETAKIDTLITKQEKLIELLKEKRQAVISHAVTKGISYKGQPDAPMKDSGVEWLGEVPEHWDVGSLNYYLSALGDVDHFMPASIEKGVPYVMTGDLTEFASGINFNDCKQVKHSDYLKLSKRIKTSKGDVIMARYATIGTASYVDTDKDFLVSYSCVTIKPNTIKVLGLYLFYYFKSQAFLQGLQSHINTNTQGNVGVSDLKTVKITLPNIDEQKLIIENLQLVISKLDDLSEKSLATIDLMKERRTALISAAVTGKIDVRDWDEQGIQE